jgi:hypothetical protein
MSAPTYFDYDLLEIEPEEETIEVEKWDLIS